MSQTMTQKIVTEGVDLPIELAVTPGSPQPCSPAINPSVTATDLSELTAEIQAAEDESGYPTGAKFYLIMISVGLVLVLGGMDASIVAVAVPSITDHFHALHDFMFGKLYKLYSFKRIFLISVAIFTGGSVPCAAAPTSAMFVAGRAVSGYANAGIIAGCFTSLVLTLPLRKRPLYGAILVAVEGISVIAAPVIGGIIVGRLSWRWCFWINLPFSAVALLIIVVFLQDLKPSEQLPWREKVSRLDLIGNAVFVPSITCLFLALTWAGNRNPWDSPIIIVLFITFGVLLGIFAFDQWRKKDNATLPPRLLRNRSVIVGFVFSLFSNSTMNVIEYYLPTYFQAVQQYTPAKSGIMMLPIVISFLIAMLIQGSGVGLVGYCVPFKLLGSILMPIFAGLMTTLTVSSNMIKLILYSGSMGFAGGIGFQPPQTAVQTSLPSDDANMGLAIILFAQHFGPAVFVTAAQSIFTTRLEENLHHLTPNLNVTSIEDLGLTDIKKAVTAGNLQGALKGLDSSLMQTWYLSVALGCATMVGSLAMEWRTLKKKRN